MSLQLFIEEFGFKVGNMLNDFSRFKISRFNYCLENYFKFEKNKEVSTNNHFLFYKNNLQFELYIGDIHFDEFLDYTFENAYMIQLRRVWDKNIQKLLLSSNFSNNLFRSNNVINVSHDEYDFVRNFQFRNLVKLINENIK